MSSKELEKSTPFAELLAKVSRAFREANIPYMVFGGQAVLMYGEPRFTQDIDITLGIDPSLGSKALQIAEDLRLEVLVEQPEAFLRQTFVLPVRDVQSGIRLDLVFSLSDFERQALERASEFLLLGEAVRFVSLNDLLIFKTIAGRARDIEDLKGLISKNPTYDRQHVLTWLRQYDQEMGEGFEERFLDVERSLAKINKS